MRVYLTFSALFALTLVVCSNGAGTEQQTATDSTSTLDGAVDIAASDVSGDDLSDLLSDLIGDRSLPSDVVDPSCPDDSHPVDSSADMRDTASEVVDSGAGDHGDVAVADTTEVDSALADERDCHSPDSIPPPVLLECEELACLACASGTRCAADGGTIEGTCCSPGDPLARLGTARGSEVVDVEYGEGLVVACGGFGATVTDVSNPDAPNYLGGAGRRCQHATIGPEIRGARIFYVTHHGDSWVTTPSLDTYRVTVEGNVSRVGGIEDREILFEGSSYSDGFLYVAAHDLGVLVYEVGETGTPIHVTTISDVGNAWKVEVESDVAYVVDNDFGVHVVSVADPENPLEIGSYPTTGQPRDVVLAEGQLYVALGGFGVDVFEVSEDNELVLTGHLETRGSAQSVDAEDGVLAVAAWSHVALYELPDMALIATQKTRSRRDFEQDLGVAIADDHVFVGEWEEVHIFRMVPGQVGPELWLDEEFFAFDSDAVGARAVIIRNLGPTTLEINDVTTTDPERFSVDSTTFSLPPGGAGVIEVYFDGSGPGSASLLISSNDLDEPSANIQLVAEDSSSRIGVGDKLTEAFAFLDPSGAGQLSGLECNVTLLAYFALF